jgi:hypothetical protein
MADEFWGRPVETFADAGGEMAVGSPAPGLLCTRAKGRASGAMATFFLDACDRVVAKAGSIEGFHDWAGLVGYESACRKAVTDWSLAHRNDVRRVHVHVTQQLVKMGVSVTSIVVPFLESYGSRASLRAAFERALAAAR